MEWAQVLVLAGVQGLTEFLPISSSAHLILVPVLTGWPDQGLAFDVAVHVGSLAAVLVYFANDFAAMLRDGLRRRLGSGEHGRLGWLVVVASIPVAAAGLALDSAVSHALRDPLVIALATIGFALVLLFAERAGAKGPADRVPRNPRCNPDRLRPGHCAHSRHVARRNHDDRRPARRSHSDRLGPILLSSGGAGDPDGRRLQGAAARCRARRTHGGPRSPPARCSPRSAPTRASTPFCDWSIGSASRLSSPTGWCSVPCCSGCSSDAAPGRIPGIVGRCDVQAEGRPVTAASLGAQSRCAEARRRSSTALRSLPPRYPGTTLSTLRGAIPSRSRSLVEQTLSTVAER